MLEAILQHLNNWFLIPDGIHAGVYTVEGGAITLPFLQNGQYFRITGSLFNDGVYQYGGANEFADETFQGAIWALAIPQSVITLAEDGPTCRLAGCVSRAAERLAEVGQPGGGTAYPAKSAVLYAPL